ncbi:tRNA nucleotidyltransferase (CCA-adding enzyme) [Oceanobacillus limi]|uniref:CCA-adding enzyme n=2 Tax=Oceanobacillus limi TaxID=930131 RepID=A0A1H9ZEX2_9BACI|nr:tRNA nucleotidyltransferase (CCA-adding enzyme) [Oceanobacillus limi]
MLKGPFLKASEIIKNIEANGHQAYFVGGCVRDLLLGHPIGDVDITTSAPPTVVQKIFDDVIPVGIEHGTVIVRHENESYEITTFRVEGQYSDHRHPDSVEFIDQIDKDLERRDFTINALAMDLNGQIMDLFAGKADLQAKVIRTVGDGDTRFVEDPLRIIRALRFSSQLGFSIEEETLKAIDRVKPKIQTIAIERITTEFNKLVQGNYVNNGIHYLKRMRIDHYLPVFSDNKGLIEKLPNNLKPLESIAELFALLHYVDPSIDVHTWFKAWKCSNRVRKEANDLSNAIFNFSRNGINLWLVYQLPVEYHARFIRLVSILLPNKFISMDQMEAYTHRLPIRSKRELEINGNDLIALHPTLPKGPWIQKLLNQIEYLVVMGKLENNRTKLKEWIKWNPPEIN